jgi:TetR/AcrR family transcriptional regulator of autoinduction and epiphytic fitness
VDTVKPDRLQAQGPRATRRERALATRRRIIEAAIVRFENPGYAATTMEAIAADARVAVQTVYFTFRTKAELLLAAVTVLGGEPGSPEDPVERPWMGDVMGAATGARRLALIVELGNEIYRRIGPLMPAVRSAGAADPDVDRVWRGLAARRRDGMRHVIELFARRDELRQGLDEELALDVLVGVHRWETYAAFVQECGWPIERYKAWQFVTLAHQLLPMDVVASAVEGSLPDVADLSFVLELRRFG